MTYHINYTNELEIKHDLDSISPFDCWMVIFVVIFK